MLENHLLSFFRDQAPLSPGSTLLVAVSGGPDSVALLHALHEVRDDLGIRLEVAHLDHGLRPESREDNRFVDRLCASLGLTLHHQRRDVAALREQEGGSVEALARRERYAFLDAAASLAGASGIATGHCAEDQIETLILNLVRGAGPRGLGGMLPVGPGLLCRPLLQVAKAEILSWLQTRDIPYREDPSNRDLSFTRNRVRRQLVPLLKEIFPFDFESVLLREAGLFAELDHYLTREAGRLLDRSRLPENPGVLRLDREKLLEPHPALQRVVLRAALEEMLGDLEGISQRHVNALVDLTRGDHPSAGLDLPQGLRARRDYEALVLAAEDSVPDAPPTRVLARTEQAKETWGTWELRWQTTSGPTEGVLPGTGSAAAEAPRGGLWEVFDADGLVPPLAVRGVRDGDRIEPLGLEGSQKVSDLLVNRKVPRRMRARIPILCDNGGPDGSERVLWVIGHRRSRHAALSGKTARMVRFEADERNRASNPV